MKGPKNVNPIHYGSQGGMVTELNGSVRWRDHKDMLKRGVDENNMEGYW